MTPPRLVLLRPRNADNLGAIARAMKNFGLEDWVVVSPNPLLLEVPGMHRLAVKAGELLESVRQVASLEEAVQGCTWVVGTTMRSIGGRQRLSPRQVAQAAPTDGPWALVFGDERSGLTNDDLTQCHALSFIAASEDQPSLNLSQAVVVYAYELYQRRLEGQAGPPPAQGAPDEQLRALKARLHAALETSGFLHHGLGEHAELDLYQSLLRGRPTKKEAGLWLAALAAFEKPKPRQP